MLSDASSSGCHGMDPCGTGVALLTLDGLVQCGWMDLGLVRSKPFAGGARRRYEDIIIGFPLKKLGCVPCVVSTVTLLFNVSRIFVSSMLLPSGTRL